MFASKALRAVPRFWRKPASVNQSRNIYKSNTVRLARNGTDAHSPRAIALVTATSESTRNHQAIYLGASLCAGVLLFNNAECETSSATSTDIVVDPISGFEFSKTYDAKSGRQVMLGLGTRTVTFLQFYVYSAAIYVSDNLKDAVKDLAPPSEGDGPMSEDLVGAIVSEKISKTIYIKPYREVDLKHMRDGFGKALTYRLQQSDKTDADQYLHMQEITEFKTLFPTREILAIGDSMELSFEGARITVTVKGKRTGTICSPYLVKTLMESYLDHTPVSTNIFKSCKDGLRSYFD